MNICCHPFYGEIGYLFLSERIEFFRPGIRGASIPSMTLFDTKGERGKRTHLY